MLLSSCQKKFNTFLHDSQLLQEGSMITGAYSITYVCDCADNYIAMLYTYYMYAL